MQIELGPETNPGIEQGAAEASNRRRPNRPTDGRLARLHLRMGSLGLARAELESLAGAGELDDPALVDLAEVRWRTGDLPGAGEAAAAYLDVTASDDGRDERDELMALVVAAEAMATAGRPAEARRLAARALERTTSGSLDPLFAGMPRSTIWPHDPGDPGQPAGVLFDDVPGTGFAAPVPGDRAETISGGKHGPVHARAETAAMAPTLWSPEPHPAPAPVSLDIPIEPWAEIESARAAVASAQIETAATRLSVVLRVAPSSAPAVLDLVTDAQHPALLVVAGDAYRLVGREAEAQRAFAAAARGLRSTGDGALTPGAQPSADSRREADSGREAEPGPSEQDAGPTPPIDRQEAT